MPPHSGTLPLRQAVALGLLQGPTELLPVSSSAHTTLVPALLGWRYGELDAPFRKSFEVSLHAGAALALALVVARERAARERCAGRGSLRWLALSSAPAALAGYLYEEGVERLGSTRQLAAALVGGGCAMALADLRGGARPARDAGALDALLIGLAQAAALIPGVSRNGATFAAARLRGFSRPDAHALSWRAAGPVMAGASLLRVLRAFRQGLPGGSAPALATGAGAALISTLACAPVLRSRRLARMPLAPFALYRLALAGLAVRRLAPRDAPPARAPARARWAARAQ
jgi:undecaprenyl-diphosphatase